MTDLIKPQIFIPNEGSKSLIDVKLEKYDNFDIYWYHWPRDGFFLVEDYEPVILVYSANGTLCYLIVRRHWQYQFYSLDELSDPVEVLFDGSFHPPFAKLKQDDDFEEKKHNLISRNYNVKMTNPNDIDAKFRTGKGHPSALGRTMKDPVDIAKEAYSDYCLKSS
jgi:hypothetical protein